MTNKKLHCWKVEGEFEGITEKYPVSDEIDPNREVTIMFW
jgi:hypothetical protein